ncbi:MAG: hypothetical protein AB7F40_00515 [Victivallaceae bacterium]|nr:hypothetical protein [Victivallaceae bacterium]
MIKTWLCGVLAAMVPAGLFAFEDELFRYLPPNPTVAAYASLDAVRGTWIEAKALQLNRTLAQKHGGVCDFTAYADQFHTGALAFYGYVSAREQIYLIRTDVKPQLFYSLLEGVVAYPLEHFEDDDQPGVVFPPEAVNRKFRDKLEVCSFYPEPGVVFFGDTGWVYKLEKRTGEGDAKAFPEFDEVPGKAFAMLLAYPQKIPLVAPFVGGADYALFYVVPAEGKDGGLIIHGKIVCSDIKAIGRPVRPAAEVAGRLAANLPALAPMLALLMPEDGTLAFEAAAGMTTKAEGNTVEITWPVSRKLAEKIFDYYAEHLR